MGRFQRQVEHEREIIGLRLGEHYRVVPPSDRTAKLDSATVDALIDHIPMMLVSEFSRTWNGREGAGP